MKTEEEMTILRLTCTITYNDYGLRYYWEKPTGGPEQGNRILYAERKTADGWECISEDKTVERPPFGVARKRI